MTPLQTLLDTRSHFLIRDGPMGTMLPTSDNHWSVPYLRSQPELIARVHDLFLQTHCVDIITTATYQLDACKMKDFVELQQKGVKIANDCVNKYLSERRKEGQDDRKILIAASISPVGANLPDGQEFSGKYMDTWSTESVIEFHRLKVEGLVEDIRAGRVQILLFETIPALEEAKCIAKALESVFTREAQSDHGALPPIDCIVSFSCKDEHQTCRGDPIEDCARFIDQCVHFSGMSVNCTGPQYISSLLKAMKKHTSKILMVYPNSGKIWDSEQERFTESEFSQDEKRFYKWAQEWYEAGARIIGGCCTTLPKDLEYARRGLEEEFHIKS